MDFSPGDFELDKNNNSIVYIAETDLVDTIHEYKNQNGRTYNLDLSELSIKLRTVEIISMCLSQLSWMVMREMTILNLDNITTNNKRGR